MQFSKLLLFALPAALAAPLVAPRGAIGYTGSNIITVVDASSNRAVGYLNSNGAFTVSRGEAAVFQATPAYSGGSVVSTPKGPCGFDPGRSYDLACDSSGKGTYADAYPFYVSRLTLLFGSSKTLGRPHSCCGRFADGMTSFIGLQWLYDIR